MMKKTIQFFATVVLFLGATINVSAQAWNISGNNIGGGEWFGADNNSIIPVRYEHQADAAPPLSRKH